MTDPGSSYGLWLLVFINSAVFILFAFSFFKPQTSRDWRSFGAFSAFIVALFVVLPHFVWRNYPETGKFRRYSCEFEEALVARERCCRSKR